MQAVTDYANNGGLVVGICNGFQILTESHLLPGALLHNQNQQFICRNVFIRPEQFTSPLTAGLRDRAYKIPIAHGEGRYYADAATLERLNKNKQVLFRYCDEKGDITGEANANGSAESIAGIVNEGGNVFGLMPHPERASEEILGNTDGRALLASLVAHVQNNVLQPQDR
jgi:phosphoribosylformylglycinamidine synthase